MAADVERTIAAHDEAHRLEIRKHEDTLAAARRETEQRLATLACVSHPLASVVLTVGLY
jgi:hypothetical protein